MSLLSDLKTILTQQNISVEIGAFSDKPGSKYAVLVPLNDKFIVSADNIPTMDVQNVRIEFFSKDNYLQDIKTLTTNILSAEYTITDRGYIEKEQETGYHHAYIDVAHYYLTEV